MSKALVVIVPLVLAIYCLVQLAQTRPGEVRTMRRGVWAVLIVLLPVLGALAWLTIGRPVRPRRPRPTRGRIVAPDDDPDFLRGLRRPRPTDRPDEQT